jgi:hypothetical protein
MKPMVDVQIEGDRAVFRVEGSDKLWALRSQLEIPLAHISGVDIDQVQARGWWHGLRVMGTNVPGVFAAGTFLSRDGLVFWDVHYPENTIIVSLVHEHYKKLIIEVSDPAATVALFRSAIPGIGAPPSP